MTTKHCNRCDTDKPELAFPMHRDGTLFNCCRECVRRDSAKYKRKHPRHRFVLTPMTPST